MSVRAVAVQCSALDLKKNVLSTKFWTGMKNPSVRTVDVLCVNDENMNAIAVNDSVVSQNRSLS